MKTRVAILGASGYTGGELIRWLAHHPHVELVALAAESNAGKTVASVWPQYARLNLPDLVNLDAIDYTNIDLVFCGLPHGTTQAVIAKLPTHLKIIDLSADFRLRDANEYAKWYGHPHQALNLQQDAVYGLTEFARDKVKTARLIANPGCYPTASLLPLLPLLEQQIINTDNIIIDAKSGVSGAGRSAKQNLLFTEVAEGFYPYGIANHRHAPEIEQELAVAANVAVTVTFTPHLVPIKRGMCATIYVQLQNGQTAEVAHAALSARYANEAFVQVLQLGETARTQNVAGTNHCQISVHADRVAGRLILVSVIDNLSKGASSQAIQNMNVMLGLPEITGLQQEAYV